ncbi:MAG: hypothetical protein PHH48_09005, partial [Eubacteriales bacterium]|nr:hypothetical protein [Eubacteriales bacterium]
QNEELHSAAIKCKGNIGRALHYLNNPDMQKVYSIAEDILNACAFGSEYDFLVSLTWLEKEKDKALDILMIVRESLCDAFLIDSGLKLQDNIANKISQSITSLQINKVIDIIDSGVKSINSNGNKSLIIAWICSQIKHILLG